MLAFHGFGQNKDLLNMFIKSFAKKCKVDYTCFNGSYELPQREDDEKDKKDKKSYCNYKYSNMEHSEIMQNVWKEKNPLPIWKSQDELKGYMITPGKKVVFGFSEGGMVAFQMAIAFPDQVSLLIIASSPFPGNMDDCKVKCPVVIISSPQDEVVDAEKTKLWGQYCDQVTFIEHSKGHKIFLPGQLKEEIRKILK